MNEQRDEKLKTFLNLEEYANAEGKKAAALLSVHASANARSAAYEIARRNAYNEGMRKAGYVAPLKKTMKE